jgi:SAM-dependent methyltransferase
MSSDPLAELKSRQRDAWSHFAPLEAVTTLPAASLVRFAAIRPGDEVLDVGCGTGVVAVTAARLGARVKGIDLSPALLDRARTNVSLAEVPAELCEGDVEAMPYPDASFDVVVSQFGHMFAPRHHMATSEMLRVLKPKGRIAFSTWPPEHFSAQLIALVARYLPAPPPIVLPPPSWGDPGYVRMLLGDAVTEVQFDRDVMWVPALSPRHYRATLELTAGPLVQLVSALKGNPHRLAALREELDALISVHFADNRVSNHFLITRARKL